MAGWRRQEKSPTLKGGYQKKGVTYRRKNLPAPTGAGAAHSESISWAGVGEGGNPERKGREVEEEVWRFRGR